MAKHLAIAISRQFGSGGREVAEIVAKKLGIKRYDQKIVAMAAENLERGDNFADALQRSYNAPNTCRGNLLGEYAFEKVAQHNRMYVEQAKVILKIAEQEDAVFLGRCADHILKDHGNIYSFFLYAGDEFREARAKTHYPGLTLKELNEEEQHRKQYYEFYTGKNWGDPQNYDLMINTSKCTLEDAAELIIHYVKEHVRA